MLTEYCSVYYTRSGSQWRRGLRRRSAAARLLTLRVRIPPRAWMFVCCECCVLSGRGLSSRGVLPTVVRRCVWSRNLVNEEAMAHWGRGGGLMRQKTKKQNMIPTGDALNKGHFILIKAINMYSTLQANASTNTQITTSTLVVICVLVVICAVLCIVCKCVLPPGDNPIAVKKCIISSNIYIFFCGAATQRGSWLPHSWGFYITQNDAPQSVEVLWTSDQLVAETSTWQHKHSQQTHIQGPGGIRTHDLSRRAAADLRLRPRGYWDRQ